MKLAQLPQIRPPAPLALFDASHGPVNWAQTGLSVHGVVRHLAAYKRIPEGTLPAQLLFLSLNAAAMPTAYGSNANALAVRMAEIYGGGHIALSPIWPASVQAQYAQALHDMDLLICGAGAHDGLLFNWLREETHIGLPADAVGDICLIPVGAGGQELRLELDGPAKVRKVLHPSPSYAELKALARRQAVIYIARGYVREDRPAARSKSAQPAAPVPPHPPLAITRAIRRLMQADDLVAESLAAGICQTLDLELV